jgi:hypothetical protein
MINAGPLNSAPINGWPRSLAYVRTRMSHGTVAAPQFRILAASQPYATRPDDAMPNLLFEGDLSKPLRFDRSIVSGGGFGKMSTGVGELELINADGSYDDLIDKYAVDGRRVVVKVGAIDASYDTFRTIYDGTALGWDLDESVLRISLRDAGYKLQTPASANLYAGTGDLEGTGDLKGKRKPVCFGFADNISPPLVIPSELVYQASDGPINAVAAVYDRGVPIAFAADHPTPAALRAATVPAGYFMACRAYGLFRLASAPAGTVTADIQGDTTGGVFARSTAQIIRRLLSRTGAVPDPAGLVVPSFDKLDAAQPSDVGYWLEPDSTATVRSVIDELMAGIGAWGDFRRDGLFQVGRLEAPSGEPNAIYTNRDILSLRRSKLPSTLSPPPWRFRCAWGRNWTTQTDVAGAVLADRVVYLSQAVRIAASGDTALGQRLKATYALAQDPDPVQSYFRREVDAQNEADRLLKLYSPTRALYSLGLKLQPLIHEIGDVIEVRDRRFDLPYGRLMRIVDISEDMTGRQIQIQAFG